MLLEDLRRLIDRHALPAGAETAIPRLHLVRQDEAAAGVDLAYQPMLCVVASGRKHVESGTRRGAVGRGQMFLSVVDAPVAASFDVPYRSATLRIDESLVAVVLADLDPAVAAAAPIGDVLGSRTEAADDRLLAAMVRWIGLLDEPEHAPALAPVAETEVLYRALVGPLGPMLRASISAGPARGVRRATRHLATHFDRPIAVAEVADVAGMSPAALHRHFKRMTGMSPIRFQQTVRLQHARRLLAGDGHSAASAAAAVGYRSATQFNRDYRRRYGLPPGRDAERLRTGTTDPLASGTSGATGALGLTPPS